MGSRRYQAMTVFRSLDRSVPSAVAISRKPSHRSCGTATARWGVPLTFGTVASRCMVGCRCTAPYFRGRSACPVNLHPGMLTTQNDPHSRFSFLGRPGVRHTHLREEEGAQ